MLLVARRNVVHMHPIFISNICREQLLLLVRMGGVISAFIALVYGGRVKEKETPALQILTKDKRPGPTFKIPTR